MAKSCAVGQCVYLHGFLTSSYCRYSHKEIIPVKGRIDEHASKHANDGEDQDQA